MSRSVMLAVLFFTVGQLCALGQTPTETARIPVAFDCQCTDTVGAAYEKDFREMLSQGSKYGLATEAAVTSNGGKVVVKNWHIGVMSLDPSPENNGQYAALSIVVLRGNDEFILQDVQMCSRTTVHECTLSTLGTFSRLLKMMGQ